MGLTSLSKEGESLHGNQQDSLESFKLVMMGEGSNIRFAPNKLGNMNSMKKLEGTSEAPLEVTLRCTSHTGAHQQSYKDKQGAPEIIEANREISEKHLSTKRRLTRDYVDQASTKTQPLDRAMGHPFTPPLECCHHKILLLSAVPPCTEYGEQTEGTRDLCAATGL